MNAAGVTLQLGQIWQHKSSPNGGEKSKSGRRVVVFNRRSKERTVQHQNTERNEEVGGAVLEE